jgi:hypothetical protein
MKCPGLLIRSVMKRYELYLITRADGERYIGITSQGISRRAWQHKNGYGSSYLKDQEFSIVKLLEGPENKISILEDFFIKDYKCSLNKIVGGKFGRGLVGSENGRAILKESDITNIVKLYEENNLTQQAIADIYGVTRGSISHVLNGKGWANVTREPVDSKRKVVPTNTRERITLLWNEGKSNREISTLLDLKYNTVYSYTKNLTSVVPHKGSTKKLNTEIVEKIYELHDEGHKPQFIADSLSIGRTSVNRYLSKREKQ